MKKLLALVMALAMLLTLPALAENVAEAPAPDIAEPATPDVAEPAAQSSMALTPDSTLYRLSLYDPTVYLNGTPTVDLTGLNLDFVLAATDYGPLGAQIEMYTGEDSAYATGLYAQLDPRGATFGVSGVSNNYFLDLTQLTGGLNPYSLLSLFPVRTTISTAAASLASAQGGVPFTSADRLEMLNDLLASYVTESTTEGDTSTHAFTVSREQGAELLQNLIAQPAALMGVNVNGGMPEFDLSGTITATGNPANGEATLAIDASGNLYDGDESLPFTLSYTDSMDAIDGTFAAEDVVLALTGSFASAEDGRPVSDVSLVMTADGSEQMSISLSAAPGEASEQVDYELSFNQLDQTIALTFSNGTYEGGFGFELGMNAAVSGIPVQSFSLGYEGEPYAIEGIRNYTTGLFWAGMNDGVNDYYFDVWVDTYDVDAATSDWLLDYDNAVDLLNMSESEQSMALLGLLGVLGNVSNQIVSDVPGLAPYIEQLLASMGTAF